MSSSAMEASPCSYLNTASILILVRVQKAQMEYSPCWLYMVQILPRNSCLRAWSFSSTKSMLAQQCSWMLRSSSEPWQDLNSRGLSWLSRMTRQCSSTLIIQYLFISPIRHERVDCEHPVVNARLGRDQLERLQLPAAAEADALPAQRAARGPPLPGGDALRRAHHGAAQLHPQCSRQLHRGRHQHPLCFPVLVHLQPHRAVSVLSSIHGPVQREVATGAVHLSVAADRHHHDRHLHRQLLGLQRLHCRQLQLQRRQHGGSCPGARSLHHLPGAGVVVQLPLLQDLQGEVHTHQGPALSSSLCIVLSISSIRSRRAQPPLPASIDASEGRTDNWPIHQNIESITHISILMPFLPPQSPRGTRFQQMCGKPYFLSQQNSLLGFSWSAKKVSSTTPPYLNSASISLSLPTNSGQLAQPSYSEGRGLVWGFRITARMFLRQTQKLLDEGLGLGKNSRSGFGVGGVGAVPDTPDVGMLGVPEAELVDFQEACGIGQPRLCDVLVSAHGRHHMQEIEGALHSLLICQILEDGLVAIDLDEVVLEFAGYVKLMGHLGQGLRVFGDPEHHARCFNVLHLGVDALPSPRVGPQVQNLLGGACAFDRWNRLREDGLAALELPAQIASLLGILQLVDSADIGVGVVQGLLGAFNLVPVVLEPRADHQVIIGEDFPSVGVHFVFGRVNFGDVLLCPMHILGQDVGHFPMREGRVTEPGAKHGPARLVVVILGTLEYADVAGIDFGPHEVRGQVEAGSATADDADLGVRGEGEQQPGGTQSHGNILYWIILLVAAPHKYYKLIAYQLYRENCTTWLLPASTPLAESYCGVNQPWKHGVIVEKGSLLWQCGQDSSILMLVLAGIMRVSVA